MCSVFGQLLSVGWEVQAQAVADRELVPRLDCIIGVQSSFVQVGTHLWLLGSPRGQRFSSGRKTQCHIVAPEFPNWKACGPGV